MIYFKVLEGANDHIVVNSIKKNVRTPYEFRDYGEKSCGDGYDILITPGDTVKIFTPKFDEMFAKFIKEMTSHSIKKEFTGCYIKKGYEAAYKSEGITDPKSIISDTIEIVNNSWEGEVGEGDLMPLSLVCKDDYLMPKIMEVKELFNWNLKLSQDVGVIELTLDGLYNSDPYSCMMIPYDIVIKYMGKNKFMKDNKKIHDLICGDLKRTYIKHGY